MTDFEYLVADAAAGDTAGRTDSLEKDITQILDGDVEEIEAAVLRLGRVLASPKGQRWERDEPGQFALWASYLDKMTSSMHSVSDRAVERLLKSYGGKPGRALQELAHLPLLEAVPQSRLAEILDLDATYVSKIVRRLVEADLVSQWKEGRDAWVRATSIGRAAHERIAGSEKERVAAVAPMMVAVTIIETTYTTAGHRAREFFASGKRPAQLWDTAA